MIAVFREKSSVSVFWLIALCIAAHSHFLINPPQVIITGKEAFFFQFLTPLNALPGFALTLLYYAIVIVQALRFNTVLNGLKMFSKQYFTVALCYILLTSLYSEWGNITPALLLNFLIIWLFSLLLKLYGSNAAKPLIYNIGMIAGVISALYVPACFLIIIVFFALGSLRIFRLNEWMVLFLGLITPLYFYIAYLFLTNQLESIQKYLPQFQPHLLSAADRIPIIVSAIALALAVLIGLLSSGANTAQTIVQIRRSWSILLAMFLLSVPLMFLLKNGNYSYLVLGLLPAAAIAGNFFIYTKSNVFQTIVFFGLIGVIIYNNWFWLKT